MINVLIDVLFITQKTNLECKKLKILINIKKKSSYILLNIQTFFEPQPGQRPNYGQPFPIHTSIYLG